MNLLLPTLCFLAKDLAKSDITENEISEKKTYTYINLSLSVETKILFLSFRRKQG